MATPDNISAEDWDRVHELALEIVNASGAAEENILRRRILPYLEELEEKYGPLPSILATRADYVADNTAKFGLLGQAYESAEASDDVLNMMEIAHSLAELHLDEYYDASEGRNWLSRLDSHLGRMPNEWLRQEYDRLSSVLATLESRDM